MNVGRNDPCPCGSGKKYKNCCMNNVISLDSVISGELDRKQDQLMDYASQHYGDEIKNIIEEFLEDVTLDEEQKEFLDFLLLAWSIFSIRFDDITIVEKFVYKIKQEKSTRTSVMRQLKKWADITASVSYIIDFIDDSMIEVEDIFTKKHKRVKVSADERSLLEKGGAIIGFLMPYGNYYTYMPMYIDLSANESEEVVNVIQNNFYQQSEFNDANEYMRHTFPNYIKLLIADTQMEVEWNNSLHKKVADLFDQFVIDLSEYPIDYAETGVLLWNLYCEKMNPSFRKPQVYAAALHYFIDSNFPGLGMYTQKQIAALYKVSETSVSRAYRQLEKGLSEEMNQIDYFLEKEFERALYED